MLFVRVPRRSACRPERAETRARAGAQSRPRGGYSRRGARGVRGARLRRGLDRRDRAPLARRRGHDLSLQRDQARVAAEGGRALVRGPDRGGAARPRGLPRRARKAASFRRAPSARARRGRGDRAACSSANCATPPIIAARVAQAEPALCRPCPRHSRRGRRGGRDPRRYSARRRARHVFRRARTYGAERRQRGFQARRRDGRVHAVSSGALARG